ETRILECCTVTADVGFRVHDRKELVVSWRVRRFFQQTLERGCTHADEVFRLLWGKERLLVVATRRPFLTLSETPPRGLLMVSVVVRVPASVFSRVGNE